MLTLLPLKMIVMVHMRRKPPDPIRRYQEQAELSIFTTKIINGCFLIPSKNKQILDSILSKINVTF